MAQKIIFLLFLFLSSSLSAEVIYNKLNYYDEKNRLYVLLKIEGMITEADIKPLEDALIDININNYRLTEDSIHLNTPGGDVYPSLQMGYLIRKYHLATMVDFKDKCASACINLLVSGSCRMALGEVHLHRTNSRYTFTNKEELDKYLNYVDKDQREYFTKMEVSPEVYELLRATPHWDSESLTGWQKLKYGLFVITSREQEYFEDIASRLIAAPKEFLHQKLIDKRNQVFEKKPFWKRFYIKHFGNYIDKEPYFQFPSCTEQMYLDQVQEYPIGTDTKYGREFEFYEAQEGYSYTLPDGNIITEHKTTMPRGENVTAFWQIDYFLKGEKEITYKQVVTLSKPTKWTSDHGKLKISKGGRVATLVKTVPNEGVLLDGWNMTEEDPAGPMKIEVFVKDKLIKTFNYQLK